MTVKVTYDSPFKSKCGCGFGFKELSSWLFHSWSGEKEICSGFRFLGVTVRYWGK